MVEQNRPTIAMLQLWQLTDSAFPIGATAHSFGLETLVSDGLLTQGNLESFLTDYVMEAGVLESLFCRRGYRLSRSNLADFEPACVALNAELSAFKIAREGRVASLALGRRLLSLVAPLVPENDTLPLQHAFRMLTQQRSEFHHSVVFGLIGHVLHLEEEETILAYLHQTMSGLISACQRLLPVGQSQAVAMLWRLKPTILAAAQQSQNALREEQDCFVSSAMLDLGGMRHATLPVRLFIS